MPKGTHFILTDMAGFLAYDLRFFTEKERLLRAKRSNGYMSFSSSITVMAVVSDSHRCFPILLYLYRHHIANIYFLCLHNTAKTPSVTIKFFCVLVIYY